MGQICKKTNWRQDTSHNQQNRIRKFRRKAHAERMQCNLRYLLKLWDIYYNLKSEMIVSVLLSFGRRAGWRSRRPLLDISTINQNWSSGISSKDIGSLGPFWIKNSWLRSEGTWRNDANSLTGEGDCSSVLVKDEIYFYFKFSETWKLSNTKKVVFGNQSLLSSLTWRQEKSMG